MDDSNILVGTASWTDKGLIDCGRFYPRKTMSAEARLRFYATQFPMVEVDSSYYAIPAPTSAQLWAERTPEGFEFNVKAFRLFTGHQAQPIVLHADIRAALGPDLPRTLYYADLPGEIRDELWRRFIDALAPLRVAGKLTAVHFQFAPWVVRNREGVALVEHCAERMAGHTVAAEFRHQSWFHGEAQARTLAWLGKLDLVHTIVDGPQGFANCVPCLWEVTNKRLAILRLHGRNHATWNMKGHETAASRFNYWYPVHELAEMVPRLQAIGTHAAKVHVIFNNNAEDQGQVAAREMTRLLRAARAATPSATPPT